MARFAIFGGDIFFWHFLRMDMDRKCQMQTQISKHQILKYEEAAKRATLTRRSLERLISKGEGPATVRISERRVGILESDLDAWMLSRRRPAPGARG
jgi:predicted DNA-binding transcriptional regulator AlpA